MSAGQVQDKLCTDNANLHNKDGHGRKGTVVAIVKGTKPSDVMYLI